MSVASVLDANALAESKIDMKLFWQAYILMRRKKRKYSWIKCIYYNAYIIIYREK